MTNLDDFADALKQQLSGFLVSYLDNCWMDFYDNWETESKQ